MTQAPKPPGQIASKIAGPADFAAAFDVSRETLDRLAIYEKLLRQWQKKALNLVAPSTLDDVWNRHFADSAQIVRLAPEASTWVDLGSGAGFPGLVVALMLADRGADFEGRVTMIESDTRKDAFLREVARQTGLSPGISPAAPRGMTVDILSARIETAATQANLAAPNVVSARALAPLDRLLSLAAPLWADHTIGVFLKGRDAAQELEAAGKAWNFTAELVPSMTEAAGRIVIIRQLERKAKE